MTSKWTGLIQIIPVAAGVFACGYHVSRIDTLFIRADAQEIEQKEMRDVCVDIHKKVTKIETILEERGHS